MNTSILQKCVEELKKDTPKIDYILGMLETVIEMSGGQISGSFGTPYIPNPVLNPPFTVTSGTPILSEEEKLAQAYGTGPIGGLS